MNQIHFKCLQCGGSQFKQQETHWTCVDCNWQCPVIEGIPVLVRNWQAHQKEIEGAKQVKPGWYEAIQPAEDVSPWRHHLKKRRKYIESVLSNYLVQAGKTKSETLLDLGCGDGNNLSFLQKYASSLYGSDYNLTRLVRTKKRFPNVVPFLADILDYPVQNQQFEIVYFNHVLEHIRDDEQALANVFKILKPGGLLILGVPNEGAWWWQLAFRLQPEMLEQTDHVNFYTAQILSQKLKAQGFKILKIKHMGWGPPHWSLDGRIRKYKWVDDSFEIVGRLLIPRQSSSLYFLVTRE